MSSDANTICQCKAIATPHTFGDHYARGEEPPPRELTAWERMAIARTLRWQHNCEKHPDVDLVCPCCHLAALGKRGGSVSSDAKRKAAKLNGAKGGRPRKKPTQAL